MSRLEMASTKHHQQQTIKGYILLIATVAAATAVSILVFFSSDLIINDPHTTTLKPPLEELPKCPLRNLSEFSPKAVGQKFLRGVPKTLEGSNCLFFDCNQDINECDNENATNYDGPKNPCCTHIIRDMSRIFDEEMCRLGLDYVVGFGSLLGLRRADRFIPWSADSDIIINSSEAMNALVMLWDSKKTGMSHHYHMINRMCITPDFAGGALMKWARPKCEEKGQYPYNGGCDFAGGALMKGARPKSKEKWLWNAGFPYMDFYLGEPKDDYNIFSVHRGNCNHLYADVFPTRRQQVYSGQFTMNFPQNPDQLLRTYYGRRWMFPPSDENKTEHGGRMCPYGPTV
jgi:hypothetical protein